MWTAEQTLPKRPRRELGMFVTFKPGQQVVVQARGGDGQHYWGRIVGADPYDYFIVRLPLVPGIMRLASAGTGLTLRLESDGELYGFTCEVVTSTHKPNLLLILSYPTSTERLPLRVHKRIRCLIPAFVENDFLSSPAFIVDLSRSGCRLVLDKSQKQKTANLMVGDQIDLSVSPDSLSSLCCKARVVSLSDLGQNRDLGITFDPEDHETQEALGGFMDRLETIDSLIDK